MHFLLAVDHLCDLCAVILFSLLDTLALLETEEVGDGDVAAQSLSGLGNVYRSFNGSTFGLQPQGRGLYRQWGLSPRPGNFNCNKDKKNTL